MATAYILKRERYMSAVIAAGADLSATDDLGDFPLLVASQRNNLPALEILLAARADVDQQASDGQTALIAAAEKRNAEIVDALIAAGAGVGIRDQKGRSAEDAARGGAIPDLALARTLAGITIDDTSAAAAPATAAEAGHDHDDMFEGGSRAGSLTGPKDMPAAIARAVKDGMCTFTATGANFHKQKWWKCVECSAAAGGDFGVCETCQACNHKSHRKEFVGVQDFYCDCGSGGGKASCITLTAPRKEERGADAAALAKYKEFLAMALFDGEISSKEQELLRKARKDLGVTDAQHAAVLAGFDLTSEAFLDMYTRENGAAPGGAVDAADVMQITAKEALVVGNSKYIQPGATLKNPYNDAQAMTRELKALGFNVVTALDVMTYDEFAAVVAKFVERLKAREKIDDGCVAFFFFAGHAIEIKGSNYLMHGNFTSAELSADGFTAKDATEDALSGYMSSQFVLQSMEDHCNTNIIILDACRNNPFKPPPKLKQRGRGSGAGGAAAAPAKTGLAALYPTGSSMVVLSAAPGFTAGDGSDENKDNGMFTNSLMKYFPRTDMHIEEIIFHVAKDVYTVSQGKQHPWKHTALLKRIYLGSKIVKK